MVSPQDFRLLRGVFSQKNGAPFQPRPGLAHSHLSGFLP